MKDNITQILTFIAVFIIIPFFGYFISVFLNWNLGWMGVAYFLFISHVLAIMFGSWLTTRDNRELVSSVMKTLEKSGRENTSYKNLPEPVQNGQVTDEWQKGDLRLFNG